MSHVFYLGPTGTFTHDAARLYFSDQADPSFVPCPSPRDVMHQVAETGQCNGVVPIENSVHGEVIPTLDALCFERSDIFVIGEVSLEVTFNLFATAVDATPHTVLSHPHALAQCQRLIASRGLREQAVSSTAEACRRVSEQQDPSLCALAAPSAGERFGLSTLVSQAEDLSGAVTRFLVVNNQFTIDAQADRTMLALLPPATGVGVLAQFSSAFAEVGVNICHLHARPLRTGPGQYLFILSVSGSPLESPTREALDRLTTRGYLVKLLGTYRSWPGPQPTAPWPRVPGLLDARGLSGIMAASQLASVSTRCAHPQ